jgi:SAM-dependent methyltransferase
MRPTYIPWVDDYASIAELYDHVTLYRERPDVAFFVDAARESGSPVLELGCGTGRVLIPIARAGIDIVGLDSSPSMLAICRGHLEQEPPAVRARIELVQGDMRSFDLGRTFGLVTIPFRPFQHLVTVEDQLACLGSIRRHLRPGGALILDLFNPSIDALAQPVGVESPPDSEFSVPDDRRVTRRFRIVSRDRTNQVNQVELIYDITHPDGHAEHRFMPSQCGISSVSRSSISWCARGSSSHSSIRGMTGVPSGPATPAS